MLGTVVPASGGTSAWGPTGSQLHRLRLVSEASTLGGMALVGLRGVLRNVVALVLILRHAGACSFF